MPIPLLLKIKQGSLDPLFVKCSDTHVEFQNKQYKFSAIYDNVISPASLDRLTGLSCALVLMGPTGSGKTTTLRSILAHQMGRNSETLFTACEVRENRAFVDMVDDGKLKRYVSSLPMEKQLKKVKLSEAFIEKVLTERKTTSTASNAQSSRSCLIVTMYSGKQAVSVVDMMGNEKYDPASETPNVFANSNVSSITQLLLTRSTRTRSSNLVTNLIFQKLSLSKMKFILHLDECGQPELIKSSLYNIVDVVKDFRVEPAKRAERAPGTTSRYVPSYARPTASSLSPRKKGAAKSFRMTKPSRLNMLTPLASRPKVSRSLTETPCARQKPINKMTENLYEVELKSLKELNSELTSSNQQLISQAQLSKDAFASSIKELKEDVSSIKNQELQILTQELASIKQRFCSLECENSELLDQEQKMKFEIDELKSAKNESESKYQQLEEAQQVNAANLKAAKEQSETIKTELAQKEMRVRELESKIKSLNDAHKADLEQKQAEAKLLREEIELLNLSLKNAESTIEKQKHMIESIADDQTRISDELFKLQQELQTKEELIQELNSQISKFERRIDLEIKKAESSEVSKAEMKRNQEENSQKLKSVQTSLEKLQREKDEITKKHNDLISYNKYIVEKYSAALEEKDNLKKDERTKAETSIKQLQEQAQEQNELIESLKEQVEGQQTEITELAKYKSKCDSLETTARKLRDESIEQRSMYEEEISELKSEIEQLQSVKFNNEKLKKRIQEFKTPSPQKLPFNPSTDIFESHSNRDYLKTLKQSMKTNTPSPKNGVLRESNLLSSDKKKLKRKASGYLGNGKSPKALARISS